ncbi:MAG TPA: DUF6088 family protein [Gemmataceae bacterium]|nr:DUF6088 family protein [Gemmataceae bacterium]
MLAVQGQILDRIRSTGRGKVFTSKDFLDLGSREAIDQALSRLARAGEIQRLGRGLYHVPQWNERLGIPLSPDADEIAEALARQTGSRIAPSGAVAANRLGLSTQIPAKPVYLTDGRTRQVRVGSLVFVMRHAGPKELPLGSRISAMVFQALRHLGRSAVDSEAISRLRRGLSPQQKGELLRDARYTTDWIADVARQVAAEEPEIVAHG